MQRTPGIPVAKAFRVVVVMGYEKNNAVLGVGCCC